MKPSTLKPFFIVGLLPILAACSEGTENFSPDTALAPHAVPGITEAPDLIEVGNFRPGPLTDDGNPQTLVDYTFDQVAYLNGGDRSSFHLVPLDASDAVDANGAEPAVDVEGDNVVTVLYNGTLLPDDYARGYLDSGIVNSDCCNVGAANPANINQSADIEPFTLTENPDLVDVERKGGKSLLYTFDEALTTDDVVQNTSGLRVYFPQATQNSTIPDAGATRVKQVDPQTLRAYFKDLPGDYTLADAVGAFVTQGSVQAAQGSRGGNDGKNAFDEVAIAATPLDGVTCNDVAVTLTGSGNIVGTNGDDVILGSDGADTIDGGKGDDIICGAGGADTINGGSGEDVLYGDAGDDVLNGDKGNDTIFGGAGTDDADGGKGDDACEAETTANCEG